MASTYTTPLADDYLALRAELGTALILLTELALESNAPAETVQTLGNLQAALREPILVLTVGEAQTGKSSLLNALFGRECCPIGPLSAAGQVRVCKYGEPAREMAVHANLIEQYLPLAFLRDFNVVDTPGTNGLAAMHQRIIEQFAPSADLILCVSSVVNPWGASAWDLLDRLQRHWLRNVVFVVQQSDLREEREVQAIVQHLKGTAMTRFGQAFPVFAVSAKRAFLSKTSGVDKARLWEDSRFGPLEDYINEIVGANETRREKLRAIDGTAQSILTGLAAGTRCDSAVAAGDRATLGRVQAVAAQHSAQAGFAVETFLHGIDTAFARCLHQGEHLLSQKLRPLVSLGLTATANARWQHHFQRNFESMLHAAVSRQVQHAFDVLESELAGRWAQLSESLQASLSGAARERLVSGEMDFSEQRRRLTQKIEVATVENLTDDRLENELQASFYKAAAELRLSCWAGAFVSAAAGAIMVTGTAPIWAGCVVAALAGSIIYFGMSAASRHERRILETYRTRVRERQTELSETVATLIREAVDGFHDRVEEVFALLNAYCGEQEESHRPLIERIDALGEAFRKIAARR